MIRKFFKGFLKTFLSPYNQSNLARSIEDYEVTHSAPITASNMAVGIAHLAANGAFSNEPAFYTYVIELYFEALRQFLGVDSAAEVFFSENG